MGEEPTRRVAVTSHQVARLAGVSQSAVSRAFTPGASISQETRSIVLEAAKALGYRPNAIARSLITAQSRIIAVVMSDLKNPFYAQVLEELGRSLAAANYHLLLFTGFKDSETAPVFDHLMQYRVDGIILASTLLSSSLSEECARAGIPIVLFNRTTERDVVSSVTSDNYTGASKLADFLVAGGHRSFAYVAGLESASTNRDRFRGFKDGLARHGVSGIIMRAGNYTREDAILAARDLLLRNDRPEAIFGANDQMAMALMDVARYEARLSVPNDVSIVGYDNIEPAGWPSYDLTTVSQPIDEMVDATVAIILQQIESGSIVSEQQVIGGEVIVRGSARVPAAGVVRRSGLPAHHQD